MGKFSERIKNNVLFVANTRYEARDKMKLSECFEGRSNISKYNRNMIDFWMKEYQYKRSKSRHGYYLYTPIKTTIS